MLCCRLNWLKNVNKECDAPNQILIRAMDPFYCVLLALAIWLETYVGATGQGGLSPYVFRFNDDLRVPEGGERPANLSRKSSLLRFSIGLSSSPTRDPLGAHSIKSYMVAATLCCTL